MVTWEYTHPIQISVSGKWKLLFLTCVPGASSSVGQSFKQLSTDESVHNLLECGGYCRFCMAILHNLSAQS